jgi:SAM-dependent methyltransferase
MNELLVGESKVERTKRKMYPEVVAGGFSRVDGTVHFYQRINALVNRDSVVLDIGAGRGRTHVDDVNSYRASLSNFRGKVAKVIGLDVDPVVLTNDSLDEAHVIVDGAFPLPDASADVAFSDYTFEHVADPAAFASEALRVVKPGGWLCARTPNKYGYISVASRLIPERFHQAVLKRAQPTRKSEDVFPTTYLLNTPSALKRHFDPRHWEHYVYTHDAEPAYFGSSLLLWKLANALSGVVPRQFGPTLMIFLRRK